MPAVDRQLQAAHDLEAFVDAQNGGPGQGWYRIVTTPQQARQVTAAGKLAVVLGIEVDSLFGCNKHSTCTPDVHQPAARPLPARSACGTSSPSI